MTKGTRFLFIQRASIRAAGIAVFSLIGGSIALADRAEELRIVNQQVLASIKASNFAQAEALAKHALPLCEDTGDVQILCKGQFLELLSDIAFDQRQYDLALDYILQSLKVREDGLGKQQFVVAQSNLRLARVLITLNRPGEAEQSAKAAVEVFEATKPEGNDLRAAIGWLTRVYIDTHRYAEALPLIDRHLQLLHQYDLPNSPEIVFTKLNAVIALNGTDQTVLAQERAHEIISQMEAVPADNASKWNFARQLLQAGSKLYLAKEYAPAESALRDALRLEEKPATSKTPMWVRKDVISEHNFLGNVLYLRGQRAEALEEQKQALSLAKLIPENDLQITTLMANIAQFYFESGNYREAMDNANQTTAILKKAGIANYTLGRAWLTLGQVQQAHSRYDEAELDFRRAQDIFDLVLSESDAQRANIRNYIGGVDLTLRKLDAAISAYQEASSMYKRFSYPDQNIGSTAFAGLAAGLSDEGRYIEAENAARASVAIEEKKEDAGASSIIQRLTTLSIVLRHEKKFDESESLANRVLKSSAPPADQATAFVTLGFIYAGTERRDAARNALEQAIEIRKANPVVHNDADIIDAYSYLVNIETGAGHYDRAEAILRVIMTRIRELGSFNALSIARHRLALAVQLQLLGKANEAEELAIQSLAAYEHELRPNDPSLKTALRTLAAIQTQNGKAAEAEANLRRVIGFDISPPATPVTETADDLIALATALRLTGESHKAATTLQRVLDSIVALPVFAQRGDVTVLRSREALGNALWVQGENEKAEKMFRDTLTEIEKGPDPTGMEAANALRALGCFLTNNGKSQEAIRLYKRALNIDERIFGAGSPETAIDHVRLGEVFRIAGQWDAALDEFNDARREFTRTNDPVFKANLFAQFAALAQDRGAVSEGLVHSEYAVQILSDAFGPHAPALIPSLSQLGRSYLLTKRIDDADEVMARIDHLANGNVSDSSSAFFDITLLRAGLLISHQDFQAAQSQLEKAAAFADHTGAPSMAAVVAYNIAQLDVLTQQYATAISQFQIAIEQFEQQFGATAPITVYGLLDLASAFEGAGDIQKAAESKAIAIEALRSLPISSVMPSTGL